MQTAYITPKTLATGTQLSNSDDAILENCGDAIMGTLSCFSTDRHFKALFAEFEETKTRALSGLYFCVLVRFLAGYGGWGNFRYTYDNLLNTSVLRAKKAGVPAVSRTRINGLGNRGSIH